MVFTILELNMAVSKLYENDWNGNLAGGIPTPLKNMSSSVGMMTFPIYGEIQFMFQTTNQ